ncbi:uncharacterized protein LOC141911263 [Tubulanus polymorphus]|uniref:uncharacterized protein LOC141911263 n=1 Tax=Tubulanus polymorphus TaxID=672921 RepID=UPI003DA219E0
MEPNCERTVKIKYSLYFGMVSSLRICLCLLGVCSVIAISALFVNFQTFRRAGELKYLPLAKKSVHSVNSYYEFREDNIEGAKTSSSSLSNRLRMKFVARELQPKWKAQYRLLVRQFDALMRRLNIKYFLFSGSLIGAYRHHGPVPWDDDFDVQLSKKDLLKIRKVFDDNDPQVKHMKIKMFKSRPWKLSFSYSHWPLVDIWPYVHIDEYIKDSTFQPWVRRNNSDIFPLVKVPFMGMMLPAPRKWRKVLLDRYGDIDKKCTSHHVSHRTFRTFRVVHTDCAALHGHFPFVTRTLKDGIMSETLKLGNRALSMWRYSVGSKDAPVDRVICD